MCNMKVSSLKEGFISVNKLGRLGKRYFKCYFTECVRLLITVTNFRALVS